MTAEKQGEIRRPYRKRKRALSELETRQRITEAAVALHQTVGPARTTVKAIAERAGVDRATVYRHFPTAEALFDACTSHYYARHPMPDPEQWAEIMAPDERLRTALLQLYAWYAETEQMLRIGIRDIDYAPAQAREAFFGYFEVVHATLMTNRRHRGRARTRMSGAIAHVINFNTWHSLVREQQLSADEAVTLVMAMVQAAAHRAPGHARQARSANPRPRSA